MVCRKFLPLANAVGIVQFVIYCTRLFGEVTKSDTPK